MKDKLLYIFTYYGYKHQLKKLKEEQKEVIQAIKWYELVDKVESNRELVNSFKEGVAEEIADCMVLLGQFMTAYGINKEYVKEVMQFKIDRTINEMGHEREGR